MIIQNTDFISSKWTSNQCKIVLLALQDLDQKTIASKLRITQQAVSKQMDAAGWMIVAENNVYFNNALLIASMLVKSKKG